MQARPAAAADATASVQSFAPGEDLTIYRVAALKPALIAALEASPALEIDLASVREIDSAGLQLLVLAKREAARLGKPLALVAHSSAVERLMELYGLVGWFGDPMVISAKASWLPRSPHGKASSASVNQENDG